jgi:hypothetical protein
VARSHGENSWGRRWPSSFPKRQNERVPGTMAPIFKQTVAPRWAPKNVCCKKKREHTSSSTKMGRSAATIPLIHIRTRYTMLKRWQAALQTPFFFFFDSTSERACRGFLFRGGKGKLSKGDQKFQNLIGRADRKGKRKGASVTSGGSIP